MSVTTAIGAKPQTDPIARLLEPVWRWLLLAPLWQVAVLAVVAFGLCDLASDPLRLVKTLGDTDDATRLNEVREFLAGRGWFDMTLPRFGGATPLISHWSRLLDLPIAALIMLFSTVTSEGTAELAARAVWPLLLFLPFVLIVGRHTEAIGGRRAALIAVLLTATCIGGRAQFLAGRIDHHNAMILGAVGGCLLLTRVFATPRLGTATGVLLGFGTAVGYEAIVLTGLTLVAASAYAAWFNRGIEGVTRTAVAFSGTLAGFFVLTQAPSSWAQIHCDALSANLVLLAACGAVGLVAVRHLADRVSPFGRIGILALSGVAGVALYGWSEPACLAGPFGQVDPAVAPVWLNEVLETRSLFRIAQTGAAAVAVLAVYVGLAIVAAWNSARLEQTDQSRIYLAMLVIALPLAVWQLKLVPYENFLVIPALALAADRLFTRIATAPNRTTELAKLLGAVVVIFGAILGLGALNDKKAKQFAAQFNTIQGCFSTDNFRALAGLPKGLAVAEIDLGPFLVALTRLDTLAAPYHRIDKAILATHDILMSSPAEAQRKLKAVGATYVVTCPGSASTKAIGPVAPDALRTLLKAGTAPAFLTPVALAGKTALKVWAVSPRP